MFISVTIQVVDTGGSPRLSVELDGGYKGEAAFAPWGSPTTVVCMKKDTPRDSSSPKRRMKASRRQEEQLANNLGGRRHKGSGNRPGYKGDVRIDGRYRIEAKYTTGKEYSVKRADLFKIRSECAAGEQPVFAIDFKEPNTLRTEDSWVLVPKSVWERYVLEEQREASTDFRPV